MQDRIFGRNSGLRVSEIALGTGNFGTKTGIGATAAREVFEAYLEAGGRFIDTAQGYQGGESEELLGSFIGERRDDLVIASKYSVGRFRTEGYARRGNSRKTMMRAIDDTLRRLNTDYLDLYWLHAHDGVTPMEEILRGLDDLVSAGKILHGGFSNFPAWRIARGAAVAEANGWAPIVGISIEYGLAERSADRELLPMAEALGIAVTAWSPLSSGFLTGDHEGDKDTTAPLPHWAQTHRPRPQDLEVRATVADVAGDLGISAAQVGYAWVLHQARTSKTALVPIIGAKSAEQLTDGLKSLGVQLPPEQLQRLDAVSRVTLGEPHDHNLFHTDLVVGDDLHPPRIPVA